MDENTEKIRQFFREQAENEKEVLFRDTEEGNFLYQLDKNNIFSNIYNYTKISIEDYICVLFPILNNNPSFEQAREGCKTLIPFINKANNFKRKKIENLFSLLQALREYCNIEDLADSNNYEKIKNSLMAETDTINYLDLVENKPINGESPVRAFEKLTYTYDKVFEGMDPEEKDKIFKCICMFCPPDREEFSLMGLVFALMNLKEKYGQAFFDTPLKIKNKEEQDKIKKAYRNESDFKIINIVNKRLSEVIQMMIKEDKNTIRSNKELDKCVKDAYKLINDINKRQFISIDYLEKRLKNVEMVNTACILELYKYVNARNNNFLKEASDQFHDNKTSKLNELVAIIAIRDYSLKNVSHDDFIYLIENVDLDGLMDALMAFKDSHNFNEQTFDNPKFVRLVANACEDTIKEIDKLIDEEILTDNIILNHPELVNKEQLFDNLKYNIEDLLNTNINIKNVKNKNSEIFYLDNNNLKNNIALAYQYDIELEDINNNNFNVYSDCKYFDLVDKFIELGLEEMIVNNPQYINEDYEITIKRILCANEIDLPVINNNKFISQIKPGHKFIVPDDDIDKFINNSSLEIMNPKVLNKIKNSTRDKISDEVINLDIVKKLDDYKVSDNTYDIDGTLISRNKVLRNLEIFKGIIGDNENLDNKILTTAMLYNTNLTLDKAIHIDDIARKVTCNDIDKKLKK